MNNKHTSIQASLLFTTLLGTLLVATQAQADSPREWGYWDDAPPVPANGFHFQHHNFGENQAHAGLDAEQQRLGTNKGELLTSAEGAWVGYVSYNVSGNDVVYSGNKVAVLQLTPVVLPSDPMVRTKGNPGTLKITSDVAALNMSFDSNNNYFTDPSNHSDFNFYNTIEGNFYGAAQTSTTSGATTQTTGKYAGSEGGSFNSESQGQYVAWFGMSNSTFSNGGTSSSYNSTYAGGYIGKVMPLSDIAAEARLGNSYSFMGSSSSGANVNVNVNFGAANWTGSWINGWNSNAFTASGNIAGATLTSTSVSGTGTNTSNSYVQGGTVTGTLIGVMNNGINSSAGIIGKTELNVGAQGSTAVKVNDVFSARLSNQNIL